ncbi:MAG: WecB/TagA/CpsF family glycosyltransferase [Leptospiraceae bacterium]|nr:WecB/TagA/CpsF family glycosyltransferase [Leptospiraceae bacterium]
MNEEIKVTHQSSKEERDYILEYQSIDVNDRPKIKLAGIEFDNLSRNHAVAVILDFINKKERFQHVLLLDPIKMMYMKEGSSLHRITKKASLVLAEAGGLDWAANNSGFKLAERISRISLMMDIIRYSEKQGLTLFFLGGKEAVIEKLFFNLIKHFPEIRIVGRHSGYLNQERDLMVKEAIRKTSPDIIFLGMNFPEQEVWIENNTGFFGKSVVIGAWNTFETLAGKIDRSPDYFSSRGLNWLWSVIKKPWRLGKLFKTIQFYVYFLLQGFKNRRA